MASAQGLRVKKNNHVVFSKPKIGRDSLQHLIGGCPITARILIVFAILDAMTPV
jgi:hypothetical protein